MQVDAAARLESVDEQLVQYRSLLTTLAQRQEDVVRLVLGSMPAEVEHPRLVLLLPEKANWKSRLSLHDTFRLYLCCEEEGCQQQGLLHEGYVVKIPGKRLRKAAPVLRVGAKLLQAACLGVKIA